MAFDVPPGSRRSPEGWEPTAPVRLVVNLADEPSYPISVLTGHPGDQGTNWRLIAPESNGSTDLIVGVFRLDPGQYHPRHLHPAGAEFYYILEGACTIGVGDEEVAAAPGMAFHFPPGVAHSARTDATQRAVLLFGFDHPSPGVTWLE